MISILRPGIPREPNSQDSPDLLQFPYRFAACVFTIVTAFLKAEMNVRAAA
jgi:hypothetical protein